MFRIGLFAKLCQVSVSVLHYYDEIGLLKPSQVDPFTGYRYYTAADEMGQLQERLISTQRGSITSLQAVFVPADDYSDPAPVAVFTHLDGSIALSRSIFEKALFPAVDPLESSSRILQPGIVGDLHYRTAGEVQKVLQRFAELKDIIAILGIEELSDEDKLIVTRPRKSKTSSPNPCSLPNASLGVRGAMSKYRKQSLASVKYSMAKWIIFRSSISTWQVPSPMCCSATNSHNP